MFFKMTTWPITIIILLTCFMAGCKSISSETPPPPTQTNSEPARIMPTALTTPVITSNQPSPTVDLSAYAFPASIDPAKRYIFYLHGKIIEDQGIPAISPDYGEYEYVAILEKLSAYGFVVISEQRPKDADSIAYARRVTEQVTNLLKAAVPAKNITVVGASKGAAITAYISYLLKNEQINFILLGSCHPDTVAEWKQSPITLYGNILSIYDDADTAYSGSCEEMFKLSEGKGIARHEEIVLHVGTGHGILYKPLDKWVTPLVQWATQ
jgi:hypothetical protein